MRRDVGRLLLCKGSFPETWVSVRRSERRPTLEAAARGEGNAAKQAQMDLLRKYGVRLLAFRGQPVKQLV